MWKVEGTGARESGQYFLVLQVNDLLYLPCFALRIFCSCMSTVRIQICLDIQASGHQGWLHGSFCNASFSFPLTRFQGAEPPHCHRTLAFPYNPCTGFPCCSSGPYFSSCPLAILDDHSLQVLILLRLFGASLGCKPLASPSTAALA